MSHTHIVTANNMSSMGLVTKVFNAVWKTTKKPFIGGHFFTCGNCTKCHTSGQDNCPAKDSTCHTCQKTSYRKQKYKKPKKTAPGAKKPNSQSQSWCQPGADEVGVQEGDLAFDEVIIPENLKLLTLADISVDVMTEAFATVDMPVISKKRASL